MAIVTRDLTTTRPARAAIAVAAAEHMAWVDNLRLLLTSLVVLHHLAITYGAEGGWLYVEDGPVTLATQIVLTIFTATSAAFYMGLFFLLAAYFTPASYDRKGAGAFLRDRLLRLGVPLVFYQVFVQPALVYVVSFHALGSYAAFLPQYLPASAASPTAPCGSPRRCCWWRRPTRSAALPSPAGGA